MRTLGFKKSIMAKKTAYFKFLNLITFASIFKKKLKLKIIGITFLTGRIENDTELGIHSLIASTFSASTINKSTLCESKILIFFTISQHFLIILP